MYRTDFISDAAETKAALLHIEHDSISTVASVTTLGHIYQVEYEH